MVTYLRVLQIPYLEDNQTVSYLNQHDVKNSVQHFQSLTAEFQDIHWVMQ